MVFCSNCGNEIKDGEAFCPICGEESAIGDRKNYRLSGPKGRNFTKAIRSKRCFFIVPLILVVCLLFAVIIIRILDKSSRASQDNQSITIFGDKAKTYSLQSPNNINQAESMSIKVGDVVRFGYYEQDNNPDNGVEEIEWDVIDVSEDKALLISKYILDRVLYNQEDVEVTWETCSLRKWLNEDFYNMAFNDSEKNRILQTELNNVCNVGNFKRPDCPYGGNSTNDKVFILSIDEILNYYDFDVWFDDYGFSEALIVDSTPYAISKGVGTDSWTEDEYDIVVSQHLENNNRWEEDYRNGVVDENKYEEHLKFYNEHIVVEDQYYKKIIGKTGSYWWVRSPGPIEDVFVVDCDGYTGAVYEDHVDDPGGGVRPAIWISVK